MAEAVPHLPVPARNADALAGWLNWHGVIVLAALGAAAATGEASWLTLAAAVSFAGLWFKRGTSGVHAREIGSIGVAAPAVEDADQVHHRVAAGHEPCEGFRIVHVRLDHVHGRQEDQVLRALAPARRDDDEVRVVDELPNDVPADEAAAAENQNPTHGCRKKLPEKVASLTAKPPPAGRSPYWTTGSLGMEATPSGVRRPGTTPRRVLRGVGSVPRTAE